MMRLPSTVTAAAVAAAALLGTGRPAAAQEKAAAKPQYIGVEACATCHKRDATGNQLAKWQASNHSKAYATLASDKAKEIGKAKGIADPQKADACLKCHVTAHGVDKAGIAEPKPGKEGFVVAHGVQCEACHGPGSEYKSRKVMKDVEAAKAAGLVIPTKEVCLKCHNQESPSYTKPFDFDEAVKKIAHPNPAKGTDTGDEG